jgi:branched-chain amino acid transport system ATP-binding protein
VTTLEAVGVTRRYGGLTAVDGVDLEVSSGEVVALIGPNGAGKTTLFSCLSGVEAPDAGSVLLDGRDLTGLSAHQWARRGVGRTFQRLELFGSLTVADNLRIGAESRRAGSLVRGLIGLPDRRSSADSAHVRQVAELLGLGPQLDRAAGGLPTGTQRLVDLGRALCRDPQVLLLDEPASGLDTTETTELQRILRGLAADGMAVLLVEHDVRLVLDVADRIYVMASGRRIAAGTPAQVRDDPAVREAYLAAADR